MASTIGPPDMELIPPHIIHLFVSTKPTPEEVEVRRKRRQELLQAMKESVKRGPPPSPPWYHPKQLWNTTRYRALRYLTLCWKAVWRNSLGRIVYIKRCKGSTPVALGEIAAMRLVRSYTTAPVPRPWFHLRWRGTSYIFMSRIEGTLLFDTWRKIDDESKAVIASQLERYVREWRSIPVPLNARISSVIDGPVWDYRTNFYGESGPWPDEASLNNQIRTWRRLERWPEKIVAAHSIKHGLCFTHGDLLTHNILVRGNLVVGIIDWESSGWFPEHWEDLKAHYAGINMRPYWHPWVPKFVPAFEQEREADQLLISLHWPCGP